MSCAAGWNIPSARQIPALGPAGGSENGVCVVNSPPMPGPRPPAVGAFHLGFKKLEELHALVSLWFGPNKKKVKFNSDRNRKRGGGAGEGEE